MADKKTVAPATHSQPSRKGKKAWRKNVDISEVQDGLDTVRDEVIKGGVIAEKSSDQLFTTDLLGDEEIEKKNRPKRLLKADEILAQRSAVPGLPGRKRKAVEVDVAQGGNRPKNGKYVSHKELQRLRTVANGVTAVAVDDHASHDPWAQPQEVETPEYDFLEPLKEKQAPKSLKQAPAPLTADGRPLAHVRKPEAGKSYNPLVQDWSALFEREGAAAVEAEKKRLAAEARAEEQERKALEEAAKVEATEKEEYATDYESAWESEWDGFQSEGEQEAHTQKQQKRKTPAERNKIKARKEREARETWEKKQKARDAEEKCIAQIAKELSARDKQPGSSSQQLDNLSSDSDENGHQTELRKRRFGKLPIPEAPLEVVLPDELQDSLRRLKPEGNLLADRYRNLLINGKLEVRKSVGQVKKKQTFRTEKWGYKDWKLTLQCLYITAILASAEANAIARSAGTNVSSSNTTSTTGTSFAMANVSFGSDTSTDELALHYDPALDESDGKARSRKRMTQAATTGPRRRSSTHVSTSNVQASNTLDQRNRTQAQGDDTEGSNGSDDEEYVTADGEQDGNENEDEDEDEDENDVHASTHARSIPDQAALAIQRSQSAQNAIAQLLKQGHSQEAALNHLVAAHQQSRRVSRQVAIGEVRAMLAFKVYTSSTHEKFDK